MSVQEELILTVPAELVRRCRGIALDMGGSVQKYVYRSQEDQEEVASEDVKYGHLHMVSFSKRELNEALEYIRQRAVLTTNGPELQTLYTTGLGCSEFGRQICQQLNIKLHQLTEYDCFVNSFFYLASRLPRTELLEPFLEEATEEPLAMIRSHLPVFVKLAADKVTHGFTIDTASVKEKLELAVGRPPAAALEAGDVPLLEAEPDIFPCVLAMCGSGFGFFKVEKDGSFKVVDASCRGGKTFVALGSLLTGALSFNELIELAAVGVQRNVDQFTDQLFDKKNFADGDQSYYTKAEEIAPRLLFCFGNTVGSKLSDLKREDLARAALNYAITDLVQLVQSICLRNNVKRLFFSGGFCSHPFVRRLLTTEYVRRSLMQSLLAQPVVPQFDFVRAGTFLGALGCLITDVEQSAAAK